MASSKAPKPDQLEEPTAQEHGDFADHAAELAATRVLEDVGEEPAPIVAREGEEPADLPEPSGGELMSMAEWREMVRFTFDMAASAGGEDFAPLMIQPNEEAQFGAATDALYRIFDRYDFTRPILMAGNSLIKDVLIVGAFAWLKVRILAVILQHRRLAAQEEAERAAAENLDNMAEATMAEGA